MEKKRRCCVGKLGCDMWGRMGCEREKKGRLVDHDAERVVEGVEAVGLGLAEAECDPQ